MLRKHPKDPVVGAATLPPGNPLRSWLDKRSLILEVIFSNKYQQWKVIIQINFGIW